MFEIIIKLKNDWIDLSGVADAELFKALSDWSSGKEDTLTIGNLSFKANEIEKITISR